MNANIAGKFTEEDRQKLNAAYSVLARIGNETASPEGAWDIFVDGAHQKLGVLLAMIGAMRQG